MDNVALTPYYTEYLDAAVNSEVMNKPNAYAWLVEFNKDFIDLGRVSLDELNDFAGFLTYERYNISELLYMLQYALDTLED